jgi:hypothetical protein
VHPVLADLGFVDALQQQLGLLAGLVDEQHVAADAAKGGVTDSGGPEVGELVGVDAVEDETELCRHQPAGLA